MALIKCSECGKEISDKAKVCVHCGCPVSVPKLIKCPECGKEISPKAAACVHCGCPVSAPQTTDPGNLQKAVNDIMPGAKFILTKDFDAVISGSPSESTSQTVYVQEMGRNVTFQLPNNFKAGEIMRVEVENDKYSHVRFRAATISQSAAPAQPASQASANSRIIETIKWYKPNGMISFLHSKAFFYLLIICGGGIYYCLDYDWDMLPMALVLFGIPILLLILGALCYPLHHVKKYFRKNGVEEAIRQDSGYMNVAITAYNVMPGKKMLKYIRSLNLAAAQKIEQQLAEAKKN